LATVTSLRDEIVPNVPKPSPIALVVCDALYRSEPGGKAALVGLFNTLAASRMPATHPQMCVYVAVTDVRPSTRFRLVVEHGESGRQIVVAPAQPPQTVNATTICDLQFMLQGVTFPEPGRYFIQFWADDFLLMQRPFDVVLIQQPGSQP
jgi:hypothetical protein